MIVDGHNSKREQNGLTSSVTGPGDGVASPNALCRSACVPFAQL